MSGKARPWTLATVRGFDLPQYTHGTEDGIPVFKYGQADRSVLATETQLNEQGKRPGGQDPAGLLWFRNRAACKWMFVPLYVIAEAKPRFPMTAAKWATIAKMNAARRVCPECGEDGGDYIRPTIGMCEACQYSRGVWPRWDYDRHAMVFGTLTVEPEYWTGDTEVTGQGADGFALAA